MSCWSLPKRLYLPTIATFLLSAMLLAPLTAIAFLKEKEALKLMFSQKCEGRAGTLEIDMNERLRLDSVLGVLYDRDSNLHDSVFNAFAVEMQTALPGIVGLGWVLSALEINSSSFSEEEHFTTKSKEEEYFATKSGGPEQRHPTLKFAYPVESFKDFTGMDAHSNSGDSRLTTALLTARDNGCTVLSAPFYIPDESRVLVAAIHPVYSRSFELAGSAGSEDRRAHFKGAAVTMLSVCDIMKFGFSFLEEEPMTVYVSDITELNQGGSEGREESRSYNNSLRLLCGISLEERPKNSIPRPLPTLLREVKTVTVGTRVWQFECVADKGFQHQYGLGTHWIALSLGVCTALPFIGLVLWNSFSIDHTQKRKEALHGVNQDELMMRFLQCTSQDLRTPIQSVSLSASQLREDLTVSRQNQVLERDKKRQRMRQKRIREHKQWGATAAGYKVDVEGATHRKQRAVADATTATTTTTTTPLLSPPTYAPPPTTTTATTTTTPPPPPPPTSTTATTTSADVTREKRLRESNSGGSRVPNSGSSSSPSIISSSPGSSPSSTGSNKITALDSMLETLDVITASMLMLDGVVSNVTLSQKLSQDSLQVRLEPEVPLLGRVRSLIQAINLVMGKTGVELRTDLDPSIPASLSCDPHLLICVLWNLVANALKWTSEGFVEVRMQRVCLVGGGDPEAEWKEKEEEDDDEGGECDKGEGGEGELGREEGVVGLLGGVEDVEVHKQRVPQHREVRAGGDGTGDADAAEEPGTGAGTRSGAGTAEAGIGGGGNRVLPSVRVTLSVTDTGKGMGDNEKVKCCEPYEHTVREFGGGCGLGLSICKRAIELLGGQLCVQSTLGEGSQFSFTVDLDLPPSRGGGSGSGGARTPAHDRLYTTTDEAGDAGTGSGGRGRMRGVLDSVAAGLGGGVKVGVRPEGPTTMLATPPLPYQSRGHPGIPPLNLLFIEDNTVNLKLGVRMLIRAGHRVTPAVDGLQGLHLMCWGTAGQASGEGVGGGSFDEGDEFDGSDSRRGSACAFDAVLTDIEMPKMCGDVMVKRYRDWEAVHRPGFHLPICALTGQVGVEQWQEYPRAGIDLVVAKPYTKEEVLGFLYMFCLKD